jgi:hypothetical protein
VSKKEDYNKSQMRRLIDDQNGVDPNEITDEDFAIFMNALFGPYKGPRYNPE